ncbi:MAG: acylphosphatase [Candidatus Doudnabacteria bacterium]
MKKHLDITIYGEIEQSGFRFQAVEVGLELNLTGVVKDYQPKQLSLSVEGEVDDLQKFLKWCHIGPEKAKIEKVDYQSSTELQNYENFSAEWFM